MGELAPWHWVIVAVVFLVLFGSRKLPDAARSLGRSLRIFTSEVGGLTSDEETPAALPGAPAPDARRGSTGAVAPAPGTAQAPAPAPPADPGGAM